MLLTECELLLSAKCCSECDVDTDINKIFFWMLEMCEIEMWEKRTVGDFFVDIGSYL